MCIRDRGQVVLHPENGRKAGGDGEGGHLMGQAPPPGGGDQHLAEPPLLQGSQRLLRPRAEGAGGAGGLVAADVVGRHRLVGFGGKVEPQPLVVVPHRKGEHLQVGLPAGDWGEPPLRQQLIFHLDTDVQVVKEGAVPVPDDTALGHSRPSSLGPAARGGDI